MNQEQYLAERIEDQIKWYNRKSRLNKNYYRTLRVVGVMVALAVPIMSSFLDGGNVPYLKLVIAVAGALVALIEGLLQLFKFRDNWTNYRAAAESLIQHKYLFSTRTAPYNIPKPFVLFVQNAEGIMAGERVAWVKLNTAEEEKLLPGKDAQPDDKAEADTRFPIDGGAPPAPPEQPEAAPAADNDSEAPVDAPDAGAHLEQDDSGGSKPTDPS